jgi:hypothetical protein
MTFVLIGSISQMLGGEALFRTYASWCAKTMASGSSGSAIVAATVPVLASITETEDPQAIHGSPFGPIAIAMPQSTLIGLPRVLVELRIGLSCPLPITQTVGADNRFAVVEADAIPDRTATTTNKHTNNLFIRVSLSGRMNCDSDIAV